MVSNVNFLITESSVSRTLFPKFHTVVYLPLGDKHILMKIFSGPKPISQKRKKI